MGPRQAVGVAAFAAAAAVLVASVLLLGGFGWRGLSLNGLNWLGGTVVSGPPHTIHRTYALNPGASLTVSANASGVTLSVDPHAHGVHMTARLYRGQAVTATHSGGALSLDEVGPGSLTVFGGKGTHIWLTVPPRLTVMASLEAGSLNVSGHYTDVEVTAQAGSVIGSALSARTLNLSTQAGNVSVAGATGVEHLTLSSQAGDITYQGAVGQSGQVSAQAWSITLDLAPSRRVWVTAEATLGQVTSGYGALARGSGWIGRGSPTGRLTVTDSVGSVTIDPWSQT